MKKFLTEKTIFQNVDYFMNEVRKNLRLFVQTRISISLQKKLIVYITFVTGASKISLRMVVRYSDTNLSPEFGNKELRFIHKRV
jgi:hypothetical protein